MITMLNKTGPRVVFVDLGRASRFYGILHE